MSNPSFSNIDLWLFELAEGNLSPEQVEQLELFLLNHPELDVDRDVWSMAKVDKQAVAYPDVASLERKRRPVGYFAFATLLLLLVGSGSYLAWNGKSSDNAVFDLKAQNEMVKQELFQQIRLSNERQVSKVQATNPVGQENGFANNATTASIQNESGTSANSNTGTFTSTDRTNQPPSANTNSTTGHVNVRTNVPNGTGIDLNNLTTQTLIENQTHLLLSEEKVGQDGFFVREAEEIDIYTGRVWNSNRSNNTGGRTFATAGNNGTSFKDRLNKFTRNLERMMNAPIALKNSRDPHYHVPGLTANDISFSSAGTLVSTRVQATSRLQWQGRENEQLMNQLSADGYSYGIRGGWGVQLNHQWYNNGGIQVAQAAFTYSPKISVNNWVSVEPSIRVKMGNKRLDLNQLESTELVEIDRGNTHDFYPNGTAPIGKSLWYKDLGLGLLVNTKWFFAGAQIDNLFKHKDNLYDNNWSDPRRAQNYFTATIGSDWVSRNEKMSLSPYLVYQKNERLSEVWAGANFQWKWFNLGLAASNNLEPAASIGVKFDHFSLLYNADYTKSQMLGDKSLSHQLTMRFVGKQNNFGKQFFKR